MILDQKPNIELPKFSAKQLAEIIVSAKEKALSLKQKTKKPCDDGPPFVCACCDGGCKRCGG